MSPCKGCVTGGHSLNAMRDLPNGSLCRLEFNSAEFEKSDFIELELVQVLSPKHLRFVPHIPEPERSNECEFRTSRSSRQPSGCAGILKYANR
jgi:hypothetical protein